MKEKTERYLAIPGIYLLSMITSSVYGMHKWGSYLSGRTSGAVVHQERTSEASYLHLCYHPLYGFAKWDKWDKKGKWGNWDKWDK